MPITTLELEAGRPKIFFSNEGEPKYIMICLPLVDGKWQVVLIT